MIFSEADHIEKILSGNKVQTRRSSYHYQVGRTYAIQPKRGAPAIPEGRILIVAKKEEYRTLGYRISNQDALAEGGYEPLNYERLYEKRNPRWNFRYAYTFKFVPTEKRGET